MNKLLSGFVAVASGLYLAGCSVFGYRGGTEEPAFNVVDRFNGVEIRHYETRYAAEVLVKGQDEEAARTTGFRALAGYIFGGNVSKSQIAMTAPVAQSSERIAMTAPVAQQIDVHGSWRIRFFLPKAITLSNAPKPTDPNVQVVAVPPEDYAVLQFSGDRSPAAVKAQSDGLLQALSHSKWHPSGATVAWFYDPPWTLPMMRRNEVAVLAQRS